MSVSPYLRNITLGQQESLLELRVRNGTSGPNGTHVTVDAVDPLLSPNRPLHLVLAVYDKGVGWIWVDGRLAGAPVAFYAVLWPGGRTRFVGIVALAACCTLAWIAYEKASLARAPILSAVMAWLAGALPASLCVLLAAAATGYCIDVSFIVASSLAACFGLAVAILGALIRRNPLLP
jgi:hypothetical protein